MPEHGVDAVVVVSGAGGGYEGRHDDAGDDGGDAGGIDRLADVVTIWSKLTGCHYLVAERGTGSG